MTRNRFSKRAVSSAAAATLFSTSACLLLAAPLTAHAAPVWTERFAGSQNRQDTPFSTAVDSHDNIVVAGIVNDTAGIESVATVKYDSAGHQLWSKTVVLDYDSISVDVAIDGNDNVTVVAQGYTYDDNDDYVPKVLLLHYSSSGKLYSNNDISDDAGYLSLLPKIFASPNGDTTLVGTVYSDDENGGSTWDVERFDSKGKLLWYDMYGGTVSESDNSPNDAAIDGQGNLVVTGSETDLYGQSFDENIAVRKYSPTGSVLYTSVYMDAIKPGEFSSPVALALDPSGSAYVTGSLYDGSSTETLILRVKPNGGYQWARHYSVTASGIGTGAFPEAITLDHSGDVVVAADDSRVAGESALLKYSPSGHRLSLTHPAQLTDISVSSLFASSRTSDLYAVGTSGTYDASTGDIDGYTENVYKVDPSGNVQNQETYTGSTEAPNAFRLDGATFDPLLDAVYTINTVDFIPGTTYKSTDDTDWVTAKFRLGG